MNDISPGAYRILFWAAIATFIAVVVLTGYDYIFRNPEEGNMEYRRANLRLEDEEYTEALAEFESVIREFPAHSPSHLGRALALMALGRNQEALEEFDLTAALEPRFAAVYANRGILNDRMGRHAEALRDYRKALEIDPSLADGPGLLTRFFRSQAEKPPTIADRAEYLERELKKPPGERKLLSPEQDAEQRSYKVEGLLEKSG